MDRLSERMGKNPLMDRINAMRQSETAQRVSEGIADVKEKLDESEAVGKIQDMRQRLGEGNEAAVTYREIRMRHPKFDMPLFLRAIKQDVPIVIKVRAHAQTRRAWLRNTDRALWSCWRSLDGKCVRQCAAASDNARRMQAYLEGAQDVLKSYCSASMLERLVGIHRVTVAEGHITDPTILEYSDVDMVDLKMLDDDPVIILHFSCQQINCVRDKFGNVVSGSPDDVNRVYYYWAVQQDGHGMVTKEGEYIPPRWKLTEMLLRGMHQLL
jgi:mitochondrial import inner membrane translocase subunit TIM44